MKKIIILVLGLLLLGATLSFAQGMDEMEFGEFIESKTKITKQDPISTEYKQIVFKCFKLLRGSLEELKKEITEKNINNEFADVLLLHAVIYQNRFDIAKYLIDIGVNLNLEDSAGRTAYELASTREWEFSKVTEYIDAYLEIEAKFKKEIKDNIN
ncbi:MAG: ankyrin repeat domain-containing protein [Elusimicrobiaceae bacterium]|jgi:hypothetical protein|nr:ankyrin repeat domain-containing protein [Elusimicrobiaceae bacterium]